MDWCLSGLERLLKRGIFNEPESVKLRKEVEKANSNNILSFIQLHGVKVSEFKIYISKENFYSRYAEYCQNNGMLPFGGPEFWKRMKKIFPRLDESRIRIDGKREYQVNLAYEDTEPDDPFKQESNIKK